VPVYHRRRSREVFVISWQRSFGENGDIYDLYMAMLFMGFSMNDYCGGMRCVGKRQAYYHGIDHAQSECQHSRWAPDTMTTGTWPEDHCTLSMKRLLWPEDNWLFRIYTSSHECLLDVTFQLEQHTQWPMQIRKVARVTVVWGRGTLWFLAILTAPTRIGNHSAPPETEKR
jgi:hypothetical protein